MPKRYQLLSSKSSDCTDEFSPNNYEECRQAEQELALARARKFVYMLCILLGVSVIFNLLQLSKALGALRNFSEPSFVGLKKNIEIALPHDDRAIDDPMWDSPDFDWNLGWIAIDSGFAKTKGVPSAMHWPWDESKGIYLLHSFHSLHCVFVLRQSIMQYHNGENQSWPFGHVTHCLHTLREDTTCNADDTPRYTGRLHAQKNWTIPSSGTGQIRKCRDWKQLLGYAREHSACYRRPLDYYVPLIDRYKNCPDGSKPWEGLEP